MTTWKQTTEAKYRIEGYQDQTAQTGYDAERTAETLKDAKREAKYMMSEEYRLSSEAVNRLTKCQIWKGNEFLLEVYA